MLWPGPPVAPDENFPAVHVRTAGPLLSDAAQLKQALRQIEELSAGFKDPAVNWVN
jgi:hypothetical protein